MIPLPLDQIGFGWRSHMPALWWLGLLYRRPHLFREATESQRRFRAIATALALYLHAVPWLFIASILRRLLLHGVVGLPSDSSQPIDVAFDIAYGIAVGIALGITLGCVFGFAFGIGFGITVGNAVGVPGGITFGIVVAIALGIRGGITFGIAVEIAVEVAVGIAFAIAVRIALGIALGTAIGIAFGMADGMAVGIADGISGGIAGGIAFAIAVLRAYYHAVHLFFVWPTAKGQWYPYHPVAWDSLCSVPFPQMDRLLVAYAEQFPDRGSAEIRRLTDHYPSQQMAALRAIATLTARQCARERNLTKLTAIAARLPEGDKGFLSQTRRIKTGVAEIGFLQTRLDTTTRPFFREPIARALRAEIEAFHGRVSGFREPLASEFRKAAQNWLEIANRQWQAAQGVMAKTPTPQVFRAGDPVDRSQEAFVHRLSAVGELESQIMHSTECPGIILYGRRRMGKSTVLRNLTGFLPSQVKIAMVSLQNPQTYESLESLIRQTKRVISGALDDAHLPSDTPDTLSGMFAWLENVNNVLKGAGERLLMALDEYEQIDEKIGQKVFTEDLLATLRESIQSHRRITWVLAGSHDITELRHAPWPSYLVSLRMIEVLPFTPEETRLLLTEPLRYSRLWQRDDPQRPRFDPTFWADNGIDRIQAEAAGWPHLVQLIAETAVDLVNDSLAETVTPELLERALDKAIVRGDSVLRLLMQTESTLPGEWDYLLRFRRQATQPPPDDEALYTSLRRRLLVVEDNGVWRLRVPLMQRWLRQRA